MLMGFGFEGVYFLFLVGELLVPMCFLSNLLISVQILSRGNRSPVMMVFLNLFLMLGISDLIVTS